MKRNTNTVDHHEICGTLVTPFTPITAMRHVFLMILMVLSAVSQAKELPDDKKLPPCKDSPNCVSSQAPGSDEEHYIAPYKVSGDSKRAWSELRSALQSHDRIIITHETDESLHAEAISLILHFVDDIDAIMDTKAGVIHIRSASRRGHSDFGVNRKRMEKIREKLRGLHVISLAQPYT